MIISFRGALLLRRDEGGVPCVYLPDSSNETRHQDDTRAVRHFARIFVRGSRIRHLGGFRPAVSDHPDHVLDLNAAQGGRPLEVVVSNGSGSPSGHLPTREFGGLPLFEAFAPGLPFEGGTRAVARVRLAGGLALTQRLTPQQYRWEIPHLDNPGEAIPLNRVSWSIDWHLSPADEEITVQVFDAGDHLIDSIGITAGRNQQEPAVIIGNLDEWDATKWPDLKVERNRQRCPDHRNEDKGGDTNCPDLDFKWLYRLFDPSEVDRRLGANRDLEYLPVPTIRSAPPIAPSGPTGPEGAAPVSGIETPTCFPGGL